MRSSKTEKTILGLNGPCDACKLQDESRWDSSWQKLNTLRKSKSETCKQGITGKEKEPKEASSVKKDVRKCMMLCYNNFITSLSFFYAMKAIQVFVRGGEELKARVGGANLNFYLLQHCRAWKHENCWKYFNLSTLTMAQIHLRMQRDSNEMELNILSRLALLLLPYFTMIKANCHTTRLIYE